MQKVLDDLEFESTVFQIVEGHQPFEIFDQIDAAYPGDVLAVFGEENHSLATAVKWSYGWDTKLIDRLTTSAAIRAHIDGQEWDCLARLVPGSILRDVINLRILESANAQVHSHQTS